ncbi:hypothetical protein, partial [Actinomadura sp. BRA 177]|uniref:hypothetical protein n=1 Tax=Actinomadura sp. BRA 177 TaxID=2745202 RepID=UPI0015952D0A
MVQLLDRVTTTGGGDRPGETRTTRLVDGATDGITVLFAAWTLIYHLGLLIRPPTSALLVVWLLGTGAARRADRARADVSYPNLPLPTKTQGEKLVGRGISTHN